MLSQLRAFQFSFIVLLIFVIVSDLTMRKRIVITDSRGAASTADGDVEAGNGQVDRERRNAGNYCYLFA